jgi:glutathione S-transferase
MKLIIGNKNYSSWSFRAWLFLTANGVKFEETRVLLDTPTTQSELQQYTDAALVPVLHDLGLVIWDSLAICEYVSDKYLQGRGWPEDVSARAHARAASAEMHSGFSALRQRMPMNCRARNRQVEINSELAANIKRIDSLWVKLRSSYKNEGPWLVGQFSIADCMFAPVALRFNTYQVKVSDPAQQYADTLRNHPCVKLWVQQAIAESEILQREEVGAIITHHA